MSAPRRGLTASRPRGWYEIIERPSPPAAPEVQDLERPLLYAADGAVLAPRAAGFRRPQENTP